MIKLYGLLSVLLFLLFNVLFAKGKNDKATVKVRFNRLDTFTLEDKAEIEKEAWYKKLYKKAELEQTNLKLFASGVKMKPEKYLLIKEGVLPISLYLYVMFAIRSYELGVALEIVLAIITAYIGSWAFENYMLNTRKKQRTEKIELNLPDFFDLLTTSIEAGLGLNQALTRVIDELKSPVSEEFSLYLTETRMGATPKEAFESMIDRNDSETFKQVISSISQASQMGLGLGKSIRTQTEFMRKIQYEKMRKKAMQAPVKMSFPLVLFIFPVLILTVIGPAAIQYLIGVK